MVKALRTSLRYGGLRQGGLQPGLGNDDIFATASLDLNFAVSKNLGTLVDATTGTNLVDFTRASSGTYVGSDGLIKTATTDAPRFDHDPTTGESLGLLVEESRTNLVLQSQALTTSPWSASAATTSLASTITDVFGGTSASFKLTEDNANSSHYVGQSFTFAASTYYSMTAWFKQGSANRDGRILLTNAAAWSGAVAPRARIEFSTGTVQSAVGFTSTRLVRYSNGWYRFTGTALTSASGGGSAVRLMVSDGGEVYQGDGTSYIYVGPCQLEVGAFPTSYIPTEGTTVTRAADVATDTTRGAALRSLFAQFRSPASDTRPIVSLDDNTANERIELFTSGTDPKLLVTDGGSAQADLDAGAITANTTARLAARFNTDNFAASVSGGDEVLDTTGTMPTVNRIRIGRNQAGNYLNGTIARITGWDIPLPMLPPVSG